MNDIILPWTCKTQNKVISICFRILKWIVLITAPIVLIHFIIIIAPDKTIKNTDIGANLEFFYGFLCTIVGYMFSFLFWYENKQLPRLPRFKCKCDEDKEI